jgi:hypothetical protein
VPDAGAAGVAYGVMPCGYGNWFWAKFAQPEYVFGYIVSYNPNDALSVPPPGIIPPP